MVEMNGATLPTGNAWFAIFDALCDEIESTRVARVPSAWLHRFGQGRILATIGHRNICDGAKGVTSEPLYRRALVLDHDPNAPAPDISRWTLNRPRAKRHENPRAVDFWGNK